MKRNISIALVLLILLASISPIWANEPREYLAQSNQEIKFRGTAIRKESRCCTVTYWRVNVEEVIFGPEISGEVEVTVSVCSDIPPIECWGDGYVDPNIDPGDTVEVYGTYSGVWGVSIIDSESYYIVKVEEVKFRGTAVRRYPAFSATWWDVEVEEVILGPQISGEIRVYTWIFDTCESGYEDPDIEEGNSVEVYGLYYEAMGDYYPEQVRTCESNDYYIIKIE